jgi:thiamine-monophosphate kinase
LASAAADVSDGLLADFGHISQASGVGATLEWRAIPLSEAARSIAPLVADMKAVVLSGGDDYELVFTAPPDAVSAIEALSGRFSTPISQIGIVNATANVCAIDEDGRDVQIEKTGYSHG